MRSPTSSSPRAAACVRVATRTMRSTSDIARPTRPPHRPRPPPIAARPIVGAIAFPPRRVARVRGIARVRFQARGRSRAPDRIPVRAPPPDGVPAPIRDRLSLATDAWSVRTRPVSICLTRSGGKKGRKVDYAMMRIPFAIGPPLLSVLSYPIWKSWFLYPASTQHAETSGRDGRAKPLAESYHSILTSK